MDRQQSQSKLGELDLFRLLHLTHLTDEEKTAYIEELTQEVFGELVSVDLPLFMTPEQLDEFSNLMADETTQVQAQEMLRKHFPDVDDYMKQKLLDLKKSLVRNNVAERLEINRQGESPDFAERSNLEQTLAAIDADDWETVDKLIPAEKAGAPLQAPTAS